MPSRRSKQLSTPMLNDHESPSFMQHAPPLRLFVTGTDTGVGKTMVASGLARALAERGEAVGVMKPAETGWEGPNDLLPRDAGFLADAAGVDDEADDIVPYVYREPLAPLVAARRTDRPIDLSVIEGAYDRLCTRHEHLLVEGAGGLSVPLTDDVDMAGLAAALQLPVLIVTRPTLGTLNHTFLTVHYARRRSLPVLGLVISGYHEDTTDAAELTNPAMMEEMCEVPVLGCIPHRTPLSNPAEAAAAFEAGCSVERIFDRYAEITTTTS